MLKIRLQRIGRRNEPHFRAVVTESTRGPKSGDFIEVVGSYNPKLGTIELDNERIAYWIEKGAKPSDTMHNFLVDAKVIDGPKVNVLPQKTPVKKEEEEQAEVPAEAPAAEEGEEAPVEETPEPAEEEEKKEEEAPTEEAKEEEQPAEEKSEE